MTDEIQSVRDDLTKRRLSTLNAYIMEHSRRYNVDPHLMVAIITVETHFRNVRGDESLDEPACGYVQVRPSTFEYEMGYETTCQRIIYDYEVGVQFLAKHLRSLIDEYGFLAAIGSYNGGPSFGGRNWRYVHKVLTHYKEFKDGRR